MAVQSLEEASKLFRTSSEFRQVCTDAPSSSAICTSFG
eukprot:CAMPEP_0197666390 /NCGR_PEP_ID=MMETSP1338-20131121/62353_1 /TAXON_ID=43686 ORGANISM="Pelagodinium beii, Strain RCC1491" /NCGR_SAMPLE_ID=MMETSP1338 /ASSEMBLY_ACC=CAM_ASM_000754 /LENGTH=37 /DNA_ID= /DNA_START= /DNA_END= /DNA_ORIENTATION=